MRILVIGSYLSDRIQSMDRYSELLVAQYQPYGHVSLWRPLSFFSRLPLLPAVARKYLAYIDKLVIFPVRLTLFSSYFDLVHIADHGFAYYSFCCVPSRCIVTCHDLLAVRGAMGDPSAATGASRIGIWLQRLIMSGLRHSGSLAFDSQASFSDYLMLGGGPSKQRCSVIPIPLNASFSCNPSHIPLNSSELNLIPASPFLLMIGSALFRKNRTLAFRVLVNLGESSPYKLVIAGAPLTDSEVILIKEYNLEDRVISIIRPSHSLLNYLYCKAHALLFPSFSEGFGWPVIEAQACACPVIASTTTSIPEVAGAGALFADPHDDLAFTNHVLSLENLGLRQGLVKQGFLNLRRYDSSVIARQLADFVFPGN